MFHSDTEEREKQLALLQKKVKELQRLWDSRKKVKAFNTSDTQLIYVFIDRAQATFDVADKDYKSEEPDGPPEIGYFTSSVSCRQPVISF